MHLAARENVENQEDKSNEMHDSLSQPANQPTIPRIQAQSNIQTQQTQTRHRPHGSTLPPTRRSSGHWAYIYALKTRRSAQNLCLQHSAIRVPFRRTVMDREPEKSVRQEVGEMEGVTNKQKQTDDVDTTDAAPEAATIAPEQRQPKRPLQGAEELRVRKLAAGDDRQFHAGVVDASEAPDATPGADENSDPLKAIDGDGSSTSIESWEYRKGDGTVERTAGVGADVLDVGMEEVGPFIRHCSNKYIAKRLRTYMHTYIYAYIHIHTSLV
jgi:hypothetical protein